MARKELPLVEALSVDKLQGEYARAKEKFSSLNRKTRDLVEELTAHHGVLSVTARVKDVESYAAKALRESESGERKYSRPIEEITDISGVRVICFTLSQVSEVCETLKSNFEVLEIVDKSAELKVQRKLGYTSLHYIVRFNSDRLKLQEYSGLQGMCSEIQVRTLLQHAWAEIEHRVQYKRAQIDDDLFNKFLALAGLIQIADREFEGVVEFSNKLNLEITRNIEAGPTDADAINVDKLSPKSRRLYEIKNMFGVPPRELIASREFEKAEIVYSAFIDEQPTQASHYKGRALARISLGKMREARTDLIEADRLNPGDKSILNAIERIDSLKTRG